MALGFRLNQNTLQFAKSTPGATDLGFRSGIESEKVMLNVILQWSSQIKMVQQQDVTPRTR